MFIININVLGKIVECNIILFYFFYILFHNKPLKPLTPRDKLEKQYLDIR